MGTKPYFLVQNIKSPELRGATVIPQMTILQTDYYGLVTQRQVR